MCVACICVSEDEDGEEWQAVVNKCEGLVHAAHVDCQASATLCLKYLTGSGCVPPRRSTNLE